LARGLHAREPEIQYGLFVVAQVTDAVVVEIALVGVRLFGAVVQRTGVRRVARIAEAVAVGVGARIAGVADAVAVGVVLIGIRIVDAVVIDVTDAVVVRVAAGDLVAREV